MKKIIPLSLALAFLSLSSCAALTRYKCNREYAAKKGMEDASAGLTSMPSRLDGSGCEGEYSASSFSKDYNYGFQQKKQEICQLSTAMAFGRTDGEAGLSAKPQRTKLNLCSDLRDMRKFESAYDNEFKKGYCSAARAAKAGLAKAQAWEDADYDSAFGECGGNLRNAYMSAYKQTMAGACTPGEAEKLGAVEANARRPMEGLASRFDRCGNVGKGNLKEVFERSYLNTKDRLDRQEAERVAAEQERLRQQKAAEFQRYTATASFLYLNRNYTSVCSISADRAYVQVEVENRYPEQVLLRGNWRVQYYNSDFAKITEDQTLEAVLITGHNKKTFQKMTLPRDAAYCRAEYAGM
jgi:hypothetical protein